MNKKKKTLKCYISPVLLKNSEKTHKMLKYRDKQSRITSTEFTESTQIACSMDPSNTESASLLTP